MTAGDSSGPAAGSVGGPAGPATPAVASAGEDGGLARVETSGEAPEAPEAPAPNISAAAVLSAVFVIAISGLVYELLAGTVASYLLGDSVTQFSTVIGVYLSAMGLGAWLSGFIDRKLLVRFVEIELALALVGGVSSSFLFFAFSRTSAFQVVLYGTVILIGTLVGLELPLLLRILQTRYALKDLVQRVLTVDYIGALVAALAFPMFIVPKLGLIRGGLVVGSINALVALLLTYAFGAGALSRAVLWRLRVEGLLVLALLGVGVAMSDKLTTLAEDDLYADPIIFAETSAYQRIVITRGRSSFQLFLNGNLQFASMDEHRYHEALVHPALVVAQDLSGRAPRRVLVLGGGDGLAVRELLKYPELEEITLVDLDPSMTRLAREHSLLSAQNGGALSDQRVHVVNADAMVWLGAPEQAGRRWDVVLIDFPDPNTFSLGKLYTTRFYRLVEAVLAPDGAIAVQATSPLMARRSYWCVAETLEAGGWSTRGYHATVPAFGEWGYFVAARRPFEIPARAPGVPTRYLDGPVMAAMFVFPPDMSRVPAEPNRLNNQVLVQYYEEEWSRWN